MYRIFPGVGISAVITLLFICFTMSLNAQRDLIKALIIDGENNHGAWPMTTAMMKDYLEQTGLFDVDIKRKSYTWQGPHNNASLGEDRIRGLLDEFKIPGVGPTTAVDDPVIDPDFKPDFSAYDVVITNLGWKASEWPESTKKEFEEFIHGGGGLVVIHAANNSFGDWDTYNRMIGLGGWGGRNQASGPYVYYDDGGNIIRDSGPGECGSHGAQQEFLITIRNEDHPITKGLPQKWMHSKDELYDRLRGPAEHMDVLATAYSDPEKNGPPWNKSVKGSGRHEPMLLTTKFGEGRVFHTVMGHTYYSMECVGFIFTFQRGVEWAATGQVTQTEVPEDFPDQENVQTRKWIRAYK